MKRLKIMLLSLAVIAVVGGALAFKANRKVAFCTVVTTGTSCSTSDACHTRLTSKHIVTTTGTTYCTTTDDGSCTNANCSSDAPVTLATD